jgi:hypothetical protein
LFVFSSEERIMQEESSDDCQRRDNATKKQVHKKHKKHKRKVTEEYYLKLQ